MDPQSKIFRSSQEVRMKNKREENRLSQKLESTSGISHRNEVKGITKEQKRIQRELEKIKAGYYKKVKPQELTAPGFSDLNSSRTKRSSDINSNVTNETLMVPLIGSNQRRRSSTNIRDMDRLSLSASDERQRRNSYRQMQLEEDSKRLQERVKNFTVKPNDDVLNSDERYEAKQNVEERDIKNKLPKTSVEWPAKSTPSISELDIHSAKDNISKRLLQKSSSTSSTNGGMVSPRPGTPLDPIGGMVSPRPGTPLDPIDKKEVVEYVDPTARRKSSVEEFLSNPVFDASLYNPDGHLRTMFTMPPMDDRFEQAKKARYIRTSEKKRASEKSLSVDNIFGHP